MRAGRLRERIAVERASVAINDLGTPTPAWAPLFTLLAEVVRQTSEEFLRGPGETVETAVVFRCRYYSGVQLGDRIVHLGTIYDIEEIVPIERRRGMELRCIAQGRAT